MTDDDPAAFDTALRKTATGRKLTLSAETPEDRNAQAAFRVALTGSDRAGDIRQRIFADPVTDDEGAL